MLAIDSKLFREYSTRRRSRVHDRDNVSGPLSMRGLVLFQGNTDAVGTRNQVGVLVSAVQQKRGLGYGDAIHGYRGSGLLALLQPDIRNWFRAILVFVGEDVHPSSRTTYV